MSVSGRILEKTAVLVQQQGTSHRNDIRLTDFIKIGHNSAKVMLQFDPVNAAPSLREVEQWFVAKFGSKVHPKLETAQTYEEQPVLTVFASLLHSVRPVSDAKEMNRVALDTYQDVHTGTIWDVSVDEGGSKFLVARSRDNLEELFQKVVLRGHDRRTPMTLANLKHASHVFGVGDTVKFVDRDLVGRGEVLDCNATGCTVSANGQKVRLDRGQIVDVLRRAPENTNSERTELHDYFSKVWGQEYADQLTHTMTKDVAEPGPAKY